MEPHANYKGSDLTPPVAGGANLQPSALACSQSCQQNSNCTVFVYCPNPTGCDNGSGRTYAYQVILRPFKSKAAALESEACRPSPDLLDLWISQKGSQRVDCVNSLTE